MIVQIGMQGVTLLSYAFDWFDQRQKKKMEKHKAEASPSETSPEVIDKKPL